MCEITKIPMMQIQVPMRMCCCLATHLNPTSLLKVYKRRKPSDPI